MLIFIDRTMTGLLQATQPDDASCSVCHSSIKLAYTSYSNNPVFMQLLLAPNNRFLVSVLHNEVTLILILITSSHDASKSITCNNVSSLTVLSNGVMRSR